MIRLKNWILAGFGFLCVGLGILGIFLPGLPTTIFLILAAWAFTRSSPAAHKWLHNHPRLGPLLLNWEQHRAVPRRAKIMMTILMTLCIGYLYYAYPDRLWLPVSLTLLLLTVATYVWRLPSKVPHSSTGSGTKPSKQAERVNSN